ncbi:MAG: winged helix-turn-helix transcriptional regulator [Alphaproteobacteria bacterium]
MPTQNNKAELDLLNAVDDETVISQAALGERLGVAAGLVNFMMKRAIGKGLVTVKKVPARRYAYLLTPKGFAEKARLVADYMNTSMGMFRKVRADFADIFSGSVSPGLGAPQFVVVGDLEMAEVALLEALRCDIDLAAVICGKTNRGNLGAVKILSNVEHLPTALADNAIFIVADIYHAQAQYDALVERYDRKRVLALQSLHVRAAKTGGPGKTNGTGKAAGTRGGR